MTSTPSGQWPAYTYIVPQIYTRAKVRLIGLGSYAPKGIITNDFFAYISTQLGDPRKAADLERVTGLKTRHVRVSTLDLCKRMAGEDAPGLIYPSDGSQDETLTDMAVIAAQRALASAGLQASDIDTVIGASSSDNDAFPTIAGLVQHRLGIPTIRATMLRGACACQTEAFQMCCEVLKAGSAKRVLLITSEGLLPNIMHVLDWKTSSLFGEGAAAYILEAVEAGETENYETFAINGSDAGQASSLYYQTPLRKDSIEMAEVDLKIQQLFKEGRGKELSVLLSQYHVGYTKMNGKEVFREAPRAMAESTDALLRHSGLSYDDISHIVPHQANSRMTRRLGELLINDYGWPQNTMEKLAHNFSYYGNLSNASIGTALVELLKAEKLKPGQWLALPAVGGGMNYGCWLLQYHGLKNVDAAIETE
ncbi:3-oxoacyl-[acyl-carrier-protein] synthase-3 [Thermosporothrix hazakensis]|jgi:3-oxoacyl-[acyl-carrier-protein] synthase-3|uniref:3-oxoacyl-[acyl-carrier-protein] synthase-3 n=2 Tax=Thermosporothrix TaxID=768650 RepID=A0A326UD08_THEHA|nr:ketoacyl-ACP synthase III [Thermosporothrix hazakensis]PZW26712.1 3-oxoacyl-[acyl-carrier-protein] synthase-3 [Thermosporothrix hazakensis]BBH89406.1 3-oxoacyl-[acyl-carrier-protein] synthase 3 [Thermosporothrix sp. COM3]GCE47589.1 3-oxoacyl-[acyl-carrier-protein] synthase 3 [Thermosporothrix hazakensis]